VRDPDLRDPRLDRAYQEAPRDEPPAALDERIRAVARRAVSARPQSVDAQTADKRRRSWASRWRIPLSVAATVLIAATLTLMVQEEKHYPASYRTAPSAPAIAPPAAEEKAAAPAVSAPAPARRPPVPAQAPARPETRSPPAAGTAPTGEERPPQAEQVRAAGSAQDGQAEMRLEQPAPADAASEALRRDRAFGDRPGRVSREAASSVLRSPEGWIDHIRSLRAQGRDAEAITELAEFRRQYPDFRLPPDLAR
jgi:hypothetical protein